MADELGDVVVIGAGVIGLTTAVTLAEAGATVAVHSADRPQETTSAVAGAMIGPVIPDADPRVPRWAETSTAVFREMAQDPASSVHMMRGRLVSNVGDDVPPWAHDVPGFERCAPEDHPAGFRVAFWAELPLVEMTQYLDDLLHRLEAAGGKIAIRSAFDLSREAPPGGVVVNCSGIGARQLAHDDSVRPVKGQHVIVDNPGLALDTFLYEGGAEREWTGYFPHGRRVVLGGVAIPDQEDRRPDTSITAGILARAMDVEPRFDDSVVMGAEVGLRPSRPTVRLEAETVRGTRVVHNYGHGGIGVTLSWGCARDVLDLVRDAPR